MHKVSGRGKVRLALGMGASLSAIALAAGSAMAQSTPTPCPGGSPGPVCTITVTDTSGQISGNPGNALVITNSGTISGDPAINVGGAVVLNLTNTADGRIATTGTNAIQLTSRTGVPLLLYGIDNAGEITGNVSLVEPVPAAPPAPGLASGPFYYIADGGTLNGNLTLGTGFSTANFVQRGAGSGVTGTISAGGGVDIYTRSYAGTQSVALGSTALPATFEIEGFEVLGAGSTLTLTGTSTRSANFSGNGNIVNAGRIDAINASPYYPSGATVSFPAIGYYQMQVATLARPNPAPGTPGLYIFPFGNALESFTNNGTINGDIRLSTASFVNSAQINLVTSGSGSVITGAANRDFAFGNSGTIAMTETGARPPSSNLEREITEIGVDAAVRVRSAVNTTDPGNATIANQGTISGGLDVQLAADAFSFENEGLIEGIETDGYFTRGLNIRLGELDFVAGPNPVTEYNAATATIRNLAAGEVRHGFAVAAAASQLSFTNAGTISASGSEGGMAFHLEQGLLPRGEYGAASDAAQLEFLNSGTINGAIDTDTQTAALSLANSGTITRTELPIDQNDPPLFGGVTAVDIENDSVGNNTIAFNNSGTILGQDRGGSGLVIENEAGDSDVPGSASSATVTVVNSGQIRATGGALVTPGPLFGQPQTTNYVEQIAALGIDVESSGSNSVTIVNQEGGLIEAGGTLSALIRPANQPYSYQALTTAIPGAHTVAVAVAAQTITITNSGTIRGGAGTDYSAGNPIIDNAIGQPNKYLAGAIHTSGDQLEDDSGYLPSTDKVVNTATGVIEGSIDLGGGDDTIENAGSINGDVFLREGNDKFVNTGALQGKIDLGAGDDTFSQLLTAAARFNATVDGGDGSDTLIFDITGSDGQFTPEFRARFTNFETFSLTGSGTGTIDAGAGPIVLNPGTEITAAPGEAAIASETGSASVANAGTVNGDVALSGGANQFQNQGIVNGAVMVAGGGNAVANQGQVMGDVVVSGTNNQVTNAPTAQIVGNVAFDTGNNTLANQGAITGSVTFAGGNNAVTNSGTITGSITAGAGNDQLVNSGRINGNVALGGGSDTYVVNGVGSVTGTIDGGTGPGTDALTLASTGTDAQRTTINGSQFTNFEQLSNTAGTNQLTGTLNVGSVNVSGGYLVGAAGSTIAGNVTVSGGTFGSAGTVNGNVAITGGTFSPGASPAIMRINGNLAIGNGTTTTFEFVPTGQSDQVIVTGGSATIGTGTTLNLTGSLTPGSSRDLIIVNGGGTISGTFTTVNRQPGIVGVLRYNSTVLQLLGTFVAPSGISMQANAGVDYVNGLFTAGTASSSLLAAVPTLLDGNNASAAAFNLVNGEAYASASQFGVQHGLALMRAGRGGFAYTGRVDAGAFSFAQGFGDWRRLKGDSAIGTSSASGNAYGLLGGLGYGRSDSSIAAFVGYIDGRQTVSALGARTDADGFVAGVSGHFASGGFSVNGTIAYDWSKAHTRRNVAGGTTVFSGKYGLRSLVVDATVGYDIAVGGNAAIRPEVGITHISTRRGATTETGSTPFSLTVDADRTKATFIDGGIRLNGTNPDALFRPWVQLGVRHQLAGNVSDASAGFAGNSARFTVLGAGRKDTVGTVGLGGAYKVGNAVSLFGAYQGEFGNGRSHNLNVGIRFGF